MKAQKKKTWSIKDSSIFSIAGSPRVSVRYPNVPNGNKQLPTSISEGTFRRRLGWLSDHVARDRALTPTATVSIRSQTNDRHDVGCCYDVYDRTQTVYRKKQQKRVLGNSVCRSTVPNLVEHGFGRYIATVGKMPAFITVKVELNKNKIRSKYDRFRVVYHKSPPRVPRNVGLDGEM